MSETINLTVEEAVTEINLTITEESPINVNFYDIAVVDPSVAAASAAASSSATAAAASASSAAAAAETVWLTKTTSNLPEGSNLYFTNTRAKTAAVLNTTAGSETDQAPSVSATKTLVATKESAITSGTTSQYWRGDKTFQTLDKTAVGLANVDNTSDASKPVSTATQTALNAKVDGVASSVDSEIMLYSSTTGKVSKRATGTGFVKATSGVYGTSSTVNAASELTGITPVANGGTGQNSLTANNILVGNGTSAVQYLAPISTNGALVVGNGASWTTNTSIAMIAWTSYTPTFSWVANVSSSSGRWRRVGNNLEVHFKITLSGATTAAGFTVSYPSGISADTSTVPVGDKTPLGLANINKSTTNSYIMGHVYYKTTTTVAVTYLRLSTYYDMPAVDNATPFSFGANDQIEGFFSVPATGFP
jgi:hypothetical protein